MKKEIIKMPEILKDKKGDPLKIPFYKKYPLKVEAIGMGFYFSGQQILIVIINLIIKLLVIKFLAPYQMKKKIPNYPMSYNYIQNILKLLFKLLLFKNKIYMNCKLIYDFNFSNLCKRISCLAPVTGSPSLENVETIP